MADGALKLPALVGTVLGIASLGPTFSLTEGRLPALSAAVAYRSTPRQHTAGAVGGRGANRQVAGV